MKNKFFSVIALIGMSNCFAMEIDKTREMQNSPKFKNIQDLIQLRKIIDLHNENYSLKRRFFISSLEVRSLAHPSKKELIEKYYFEILKVTTRERLEINLSVNLRTLKNEIPVMVNHVLESEKNINNVLVNTELDQPDAKLWLSRVKIIGEFSCAKTNKLIEQNPGILLLDEPETIYATFRLQDHAKFIEAYNTHKPNLEKTYQSILNDLSDKEKESLPLALYPELFPNAALEEGKKIEID